MALARHVDEQEIIRNSHDHPNHRHLRKGRRHLMNGGYASRFDVGGADVPKYKIPNEGMDSKSAYQLLHEELVLDGAPTLNLASFVSTWMPEEGLKLVVENLNKNLADQDEYPASVNLQTRCISMIANLWKVPKDCKAIGTATGGSSEAIMLGGLAMKKIWQQKMKEQNKDHYHPNVVFGSNAQCAIEKFARYFDVEARLVPVTKESRYVLSPQEAIKLVDENTIGVIIILGSTYNGGFEDVKGMSDLLDEYEAKTGISIPIHVDAASGGFVAPFVYPKYEWGFSIPRVHSINASGHKFGLTYVGLGWIIFKDESLLPKDLIFELHYLGSVEYSFNLNFSRPAAPVIAQMFNFLNLGFEGYRRIISQELSNARLLSRALEASKYYEVVSEIHHPIQGESAGISETVKRTLTSNGHEEDPLSYQKGLPVVAFKLSDAFKEEFPFVKQVWIQDLLRKKQWIVPNYSFPPNCQDIEILRVVFRESMSLDLVERLYGDIIAVTESLMGAGSEAAMLASVYEQKPEKQAETPTKLGADFKESTQQAFSRVC